MSAPQQPAGEQAPGGIDLKARMFGDRMAIKMLVAAGYVTEAKANEALSIAHGFDKGPLAEAQGGGEVVVFDIERARTLIEYVVGYARSSELKPLSSDACVALRDLHAILHAAPPSAPVGVEGLHRIVDRMAADRSYERGQAVEDLREALAQQPAAQVPRVTIDLRGGGRLLNANINGAQWLEIMANEPHSVDNCHFIGHCTTYEGVAIRGASFTQQPAAVDGAIAWVRLSGSQGEPPGAMTVTAELRDGREIVLIRDNGNEIDHAVNLSAALAAQAGGGK